MCCSVLQCVAVCCSVLQCVAVCCVAVKRYIWKEPYSCEKCVAVCCSVLCCSVLQRVAACCSVLWYIWRELYSFKTRHPDVKSALQCVAVCYVAATCSVLRREKRPPHVKFTIEINDRRFCHVKRALLLWKVCCSMLQCVVLQCVAACCSVLQCVAIYLKRAWLIWKETSRCEKCVAVCCSVLCCSELQRVAAWKETSTCEIYNWNEWSKILRLRTKETYTCKKRPTRVKSDLHMSKVTLKRAIAMHDGRNHAHEQKRLLNGKRELHMWKV